MANKRMFDKRVIDSDSFLEMPLTTQAVYFHLNMRADDDGFVDNWKSILRTVGGKEDDVKVLISKNFIIPFENGVIVIKHWRLNNILRKDRYVATIYQDEKKQLIAENSGEYSLGIPNGNHLAPQYRIEENSREKNTSSSTNTIEPIVETTMSEVTTPSVTIPNEDDENNNKEKNIFELVEQAFGRPLSPAEFEEINKWTDTDLTRHAIRIAELNRATKISYIVTILRNYERNGIRSTFEAKEFDKKFQEKKSRYTATDSKKPTKGFTPNEKITFPNGLVGYYDEKGNIHYEK